MISRSHQTMQHFENLKVILQSIHPKLGEIDFNELDRNQDPIRDFQEMLNQIEFPKDVNFRELLSELRKYGYYMTIKDKEKKYVVLTATHLSMLERQLPIDSMDSKDFINPSHYDVLLTDVDHTVLVDKVSQELNVNYLTKANDDGISHIFNGILFGTNLRPMINLPIPLVVNQPLMSFL